MLLQTCSILTSINLATLAEQQFTFESLLNVGKEYLCKSKIYTLVSDPSIPKNVLKQFVLDILVCACDASKYRSTSSSSYTTYFYIDLSEYVLEELLDLCYCPSDLEIHLDRLSATTRSAVQQISNIDEFINTLRQNVRQVLDKDLKNLSDKCEIDLVNLMLLCFPDSLFETLRNAASAINTKAESISIKHPIGIEELGDKIVSNCIKDNVKSIDQVADALEAELKKLIPTTPILEGTLTTHLKSHKISFTKIKSGLLV